MLIIKSRFMWKHWFANKFNYLMWNKFNTQYIAANIWKWERVMSFMRIVAYGPYNIFQ